MWNVSDGAAGEEVNCGHHSATTSRLAIRLPYRAQGHIPRIQHYEGVDGLKSVHRWRDTISMATTNNSADLNFI